MSADLSPYALGRALDALDVDDAEGAVPAGTSHDGPPPTRRVTLGDVLDVAGEAARLYRYADVLGVRREGEAVAVRVGCPRWMNPKEEVGLLPAFVRGRVADVWPGPVVVHIEHVASPPSPPSSPPVGAPEP
jgi:hypothetical protein